MCPQAQWAWVHMCAAYARTRATSSAGGLDDALNRALQLRRHAAVARVAPVGLARLPSTPPRRQTGHGLEVRSEHDRPPAPRDLEDLPVDDRLRLDRSLPLLGVAVVDDDVRDAARVADPREERDVALPSALEHHDPLLVGLDPERLEHEREGELLGASFDEQCRPCEEELGAVAVELREHAERFRLLERLRLEERRPLRCVMADERELLHPVDAEEDGRVRRVEDLVAALPEHPDHPEEMPLQVRAQIELRLLEEEDEATQVRCEQALHPHHE